MATPDPNGPDEGTGNRTSTYTGTRTGTRTDPPVACTLSSDGAAQRVGEWRLFLAASTLDSCRPSEQSLHLRLRPHPDDLVAAADLAGREAACCAFFDFSIDIRVGSTWLIVTVPPDAVAVLNNFAELLPAARQLPERP